MQFSPLILSISLLAFEATSVAAQGWCKVSIFKRQRHRNDKEIQSVYVETNKEAFWTFNGEKIKIKADDTCGSVSLLSGVMDETKYELVGEPHPITTCT
ncbi:uncharacterized protein PgNI_02015 [Pyricularia grisea]|uniref:Uncharacterized protein n=1 Tax=Pyricularia grisea TaxID=148305 RepID=A0A6P8BKD5_PYRGI|nr:uncharacterized protein PgNI_02015 [Pyricularia grisea]TLD17120.1 hypothetical protein PgNI_02015 [Pyricularia grisea]